MRQLLSSRSAIADKSDSAASSQLWFFLPQIKGAAEELSISVKLRTSGRLSGIHAAARSSSLPHPPRGLTASPLPRHQFQEMALFACSAQRRPLSLLPLPSASLLTLCLSHFPFPIYLS